MAMDSPGGHQTEERRGMPTSLSSHGPQHQRLKRGISASRGVGVGGDEYSGVGVSGRHRHCSVGLGAATAPMINANMNTSAPNSPSALSSQQRKCDLVDSSDEEDDAKHSASCGYVASAVKSTLDHENNNCSERNGNLAKGKRLNKKLSRSPTGSVPKSQRKSPPEFQSNKGKWTSPSSKRALKPPSSLQSRWLPPDAKSNQTQPQTIQPNQAMVLLKALEKQACSASVEKEKGNQIANFQPKKKSTVDANALSKGGAAISNLEESYFKRPMPNPVSSSLSIPAQQKDVLNNEGDKQNKYALSKNATLALKDDELSLSSESTHHHSNGSGSKPTPTEGKAQMGPKKQDNVITEAKTDSKILKIEENQNAEAKFNAIVKRPFEAYVKQQFIQMGNDQVIDLVDDSDEEEDVKMSARAAENKTIETESNASAAENDDNGQEDEDAELERAMRLSLEESQNAMQHRRQSNENFAAAENNANGQEDEDAALERAMRLSLEESQNAMQYRHQSNQNVSLNYRKLNRVEFQWSVDTFIEVQGGYQKIESGKMVKHGNANQMKKSSIAEGGGQNQTGAEYGRYGINRMWRVFDVLEGKEDVELDESDLPTKAGQKEAPRNCSDDGLKRKLESKSRLKDLPGAEIKGFLDVGHGLGIQVLQAAWSIGVPARGVEIMVDRHVIAEVVRDGVLESLRTDPPDSTMVELKLADFSRAIIPDKKTKKRDEELRSFLLFKDKSVEVQKGLVIFINNAEEVFGARSNQSGDGSCLDAYLANLFANMQVGGRMVTLTDVSMHLNQDSDSGWFSHTVFGSGTNAVSWGSGNKSLDVHVLTKLSNKWFCRNKKCPYKNLGAEPFASNGVVNDNGDLCEACMYCQVAPAKRSTRPRKPSRKRRKEDD